MMISILRKLQLSKRKYFNPKKKNREVKSKGREKEGKGKLRSLILIRKKLRKRKFRKSRNLSLNLMKIFWKNLKLKRRSRSQE